MPHEQLHRLDLNLLLAFEALMAERSVTRAAVRMSVGQPAMSASLARLRSFFGDPLLVRDGRSLVPTLRAVELRAAFQEALDLIDSALRASRGFDPRTARRTFTLMASDYVLLFLLGPLVAALEAEAPNLRLLIRPVAVDYAEQLSRPGLDLLILPEESAELRVSSARLFTDHLVCAVDARHPEVGERLTEEQFRTLPLVSYSAGFADPIIERLFRRQGVERVPAIGTQSLVIQPLVLAGTRMMAVVPERLGRYFGSQAPLLSQASTGSQASIRLLEPPQPFEPLHLGMYWQPRADSDPGHRWLRERVLQAAAALDGEESMATMADIDKSS
ncbi:LysR family transcriptional regulator [Catenulispora sp. NF23]|uniref:LysR family transcriptional regulator n=1 Tax=Catenulispora pinistramenti TaxID=2705254 RepID=UPI001BA4AD4E|nr:LysR family transcriptional regulator [Catenulispora pinistramenti]MBS2538729.1 LysR family transcriptional regulator [Catenulispora pinistramenti]